jgi:tetratricopeptide (TPR) repeat protein
MVALLLLAMWCPGCEGADSDGASRAEERERQAAALFELGRYGEAAAHQEKAIRLWTEVSRTRPVNLMVSYFNLACFYVADAKVSTAQRAAEAAREQFSREGGTAVDRARIAVLLGQIHFRAGHYAEAEREFEAGLPHLTGFHKAKVINDLGSVYAARGDLARGRRMIEQAAAISAEHGSVSNPGHGLILGNLALICFRSGDLAGASSLYQRAISILELAPPGAHETQLGMLLAEYSQVLRKSGHKREAKLVEQRARNVFGGSLVESRHRVDVRSLR